MYRKTDKTEERKDEKRRLICATAARVFAERGYHGTAVKDITEAAGISVGTFYLYFKNKEDLFETLYDEMEQIVSSINQHALTRAELHNAPERFTRVMASTIWAYQRCRALTKIMLIEAVGLNPRFEQKYAQLNHDSCATIEAVLSDLKASGIVDVPDVKIAALAYQGSFNVIIYWLRNNETGDLNDCTYPLVVFVLQGLKIAFRHEEIKQYAADTVKDLDANAGIFAVLMGETAASGDPAQLERK